MADYAPQATTEDIECWMVKATENAEKETL